MMDANFYDSRGFCILMTAGTSKEIFSMAEEYPTWKTAIVTTPVTPARIPKLVQIKIRTTTEQARHLARYKKRLTKVRINK